MPGLSTADHRVSPPRIDIPRIAHCLAAARRGPRLRTHGNDNA